MGRKWILIIMRVQRLHNSPENDFTYRSLKTTFFARKEPVVSKKILQCTYTQPKAWRKHLNCRRRRCGQILFHLRFLLMFKIEFFAPYMIPTTDWTKRPFKTFPKPTQKQQSTLRAGFFFGKEGCSVQFKQSR